MVNKLSFTGVTSKEGKIEWVDSFLQACATMNISKVEELIHDDAIINNETKWSFLQQIKDRFVLFSNYASLQIKYEICILCYRGCQITYLEASPGLGIGFYFHEEDGKVMDITICNGSTGNFKEAKNKELFYNEYSKPEPI